MVRYFQTIHDFVRILLDSYLVLGVIITDFNPFTPFGIVPLFALLGQPFTPVNAIGRGRQQRGEHVSGPSP
jgi:hypothetical protein